MLMLKIMWNDSTKPPISKTKNNFIKFMRSEGSGIDIYFSLEEVVR